MRIAIEPLASTYADDPVTQRGVDMVRAYLKDEANVLRFMLEPNQILLLDNWSVLHGRTAFADGDTRRLHRINFLGDAPFAEERLELGIRP